MTELQHDWAESLGGGLYLQSYPAEAKAIREGLDSFISFFEHFITTIEKPYAWIVELGGMMWLAKDDRRELIELGERTASYAALYNAGTAIVAEGRIARGLVKTVYLVRKPPFPTKVVASKSAGETWARAQLVGHSRSRKPD